MNWYCLNTRPSKESPVENYLSGRLGLATYAPRIIQEKIVRGVPTEIAGALFPRYLFCRLELDDHYHAVRQTPDLVDLVRCGSEPAVVSATMIAQLKGWAGEGVDILNFQPGYQTDAHVEISSGPLRALPDTILHTNARERVDILLSILQNGSPGTSAQPSPIEIGK